MKRHRQHLSEIVAKLTPVDANWLDEHAENCIALLHAFPEKNKFGHEDIAGLLDRDFQAASTVIRLFLCGAEA